MTLDAIDSMPADAGALINLERSTPPRPVGLEEAIRKGFTQLAQQDGIVDIIRKHRFAGEPDDLECAADWLSGRFGTRPDPRRMILTNGAQNAMVMTLAMVAQQGDTILVEDLSYHGLRKQAELQGLKVRAIAMDGEGALPDAFEAACREGGTKALFLMPTVHNPTTGVMSSERRQEIARIARHHGVSIIEDDVYGILPQDVPRPFAASAPDITWHIASFAKCIGPGVRIGYLVVPDRTEAERTVARFYGMSSWFAAAASAELVRLWLVDGTMHRLTDGVRQEAVARQALATKHLKAARFFSRPDALYLWLDLGSAWLQDDFVEAARGRGVIVRPGRLFATNPERSPNFVRIVVGSPDTREELDRAMAVIGRLLTERRKT